MTRSQAPTPQTRAKVERRERLDKLVASGEVTLSQAALIGLREPPTAVRLRAEKLSRELKAGAFGGVAGAGSSVTKAG